MVVPSQSVARLEARVAGEHPSPLIGTAQSARSAAPTTTLVPKSQAAVAAPPITPPIPPRIPPSSARVVGEDRFGAALSFAVATGFERRLTWATAAQVRLGTGVGR